MFDVGEADFAQGAGAAAAVLEVDLLERVGGDLLELGIGGALLLGVEEAGGRTSSRTARVRLRAASFSSPSTTWTTAMGWSSVCVVKMSERFVGMLVFRWSSFVVVPPCVSTPMEKGATSGSITSFTIPVRTPA